MGDDETVAELTYKRAKLGLAFKGFLVVATVSGVVKVAGDFLDVAKKGGTRAEDLVDSRGSWRESLDEGEKTFRESGDGVISFGPSPSAW